MKLKMRAPNLIIKLLYIPGDSLTFNDLLLYIMRAPVQVRFRH
jgi:hypothetical protein